TKAVTACPSARAWRTRCPPTPPVAPHTASFNGLLRRADPDKGWWLGRCAEQRPGGHALAQITVAVWHGVAEQRVGLKHGHSSPTVFTYSNCLDNRSVYHGGMTTDSQPATAPSEGLTEETREILGCVPLLAAYFRWANMQMPHQLRDLFEHHGLSARHGGVLAQLTVDPAIAVGELARRLGVSVPTASQLVGDLHRASVVERHEDPDNRRRILVSITAHHRGDVEQLVAGRAEPLLR